MEYDKTPAKKFNDGVPDYLDIQKEADKRVLNKFAPFSLLVNNNLDIVHFRGKTSLFLEPSSGNASLKSF